MFDQKNFSSIILKTLAGLLLVYLIVFVGSLTRNNLKKFNFIGKAERPQNTIAISGEGKAVGSPDVAVVEIGLITEKADVASAQKENTEKMNKLMAETRKLGVKEEDIQTKQYLIYPKYDYLDGRSVLSGYTVQQSVSLKIRDLAKISAILAKVGEVGVNQVSGLNFTIDDPETLRQTARENALFDAREKAQSLAGSLGLKLVRVVSFNEYAPSSPDLYLPMARAEGMGGGGPDIKSGVLEVAVNVNLVYEVE